MASGRLLGALIASLAVVGSGGGRAARVTGAAGQTAPATSPPGQATRAPVKGPEAGQASAPGPSRPSNWDEMNDGERADWLNRQQDHEMEESVPINGPPALVQSPPLPTVQQETRQPQEETLQSMDAHLEAINRQTAAGATSQERLAALAQQQAEDDLARQERLAGYGDALQSLSGLDRALSDGTATDEAGQIADVEQSLEELRANADATAGRDETLALDQALQQAAKAQSAFSASDWLSAQYALYAARAALQRAASGVAGPTGAAPAGVGY